MKTSCLMLLPLVFLISGFHSIAPGEDHYNPEPLATQGNQSCDNNFGLSSGGDNDCPCSNGAKQCDLTRRSAYVGPQDGAQNQQVASPFGVKLMMSQGFSQVVDSGVAGLGNLPAGCSSCGGGGSIPLDSQMLRFTWSRLWWSTWQHSGSLGRSMYSNYDYYVIKTIDTIEFRDPNTGFTERFVDSGGSFIPAPGVKYRSLVTEATATHVTLRIPGGLKIRFEVTNYIENGAYNRCRLQHVEDLNGNKITFSYTLPATNATSSVMKWSSAVDPYGRTTTFNYIVWSGLNVLDSVTLPDNHTIDYVYNVDNVLFPNKVIYGVGGTPSGIESTWYATTIVKVNESLLPSDHYLWEVKLSNAAFGRVRSFKRFDGNYVLARSVQNGTTTTWSQNVVKQIVKSDSQQLVSSRQQLLDGTWETNVDYTAADFLPPTAYQLPASAGVPLRTQSVIRDATTDVVTRRDYADGTHELYAYNAFNQMTSFTDRNGNIQEWEYNVTGDLEKHTVAVGTAIEADEHWTYNAKGQVLTYEDFNTNVTTYEYYPAAHAAQFELKKIILPNGAGQPAGEIVFTYDAFGRVETVTDPVGRTSTFEYDAAGRHIKTTYADTSTEETVYDTGVKSAQVLKTIDRNGNETRFTYDATGRLETRKVHQGATATVLTTTTLTYDAATGLLLSRDIDGDVTEMEYDYLNRVKKTTVYPQAAQALVMENVYNRYRLEKMIDYYGRDTNYTYDDLDRILSRVVELKAGGATITTSTEYDDQGNVEATIDGNGNRTEYQYDERNRRIETTYAVGSAVEATTHTEYDDNSNVKKFIDERTHDWISTYTVRNQLLTSTNPEGNATAYTYTADTLVATVTNANSHVTTTSYYACCARIEKITDDDGFFKTFEYDFNGNRTKLTDESNRVITWEYDGLNRQTKQRVDPTGLNLITLTSYDVTPGVIGQTSTVTSPASQVVTTKVDGLGRTSIISGDTTKITYTYDVVIGMGADTGLVKTTVTTDPDTLAITRSQLTDGAGRTIKALDGFGNADSFTYDNDNNMLTVTDRDGKVTTNTYDERNRQKTSQGDTGGIAATTTTVYDDTNNVETITDAQSKVTKYTYDDANRRLTTIYAFGTADARTWTVTYKPLGQVATLTKPNGILIEYSYEDRELLSQRVYKQGMVVLGTDTCTYHPNRLLKTAHGGLYNTDLDRSTLAADYDLANRVIHEQANIGAGLKPLSYQYAPDSLLSQTTYPGGTVVAQTYDTHRLLNEVKIGGVTQASHTYDTADRPATRPYVNGTQAAWTLDANNRTTKLKHATTGMAPVTFQEWDYRYTNADNPLVQDDVTPGLTVHGEAYTYDGLHRVNDFKRGTVVANTVPAPTSFQTWTLSKVGDWTSWNDNGAVDTRTHNNIHALTARSAVGNPQTYDQNFNQTDDGAAFLFEYDANDMLQTVKNRATMAVIAEYRYDALNRRVEKNVGGTITRYYHRGQQVIEERNGADAVTAFYTYGNYIDSRLTMDRGGARHYYHENRMYSTYVMTDNTGAVAERYAYTGYGVLTTYNAAYGVPQTTSRLGNPYAFTGRELDGETLLYYYNARTYDPVQGRFKQLDPIGLLAGTNCYQYTSGNPVVYVDPGGLAPAPVDPVKGVPSVNCDQVCGPDVTEWFYKDLKDQLAYVKQAEAETTGERQKRFYYTAKFNFAYKWLNFTVVGTNCATGPCNDTVWLAGTCVRKNVLGNIAFGALAAATPFSGTKQDVRTAYHVGDKYSPASSLAGVQRADNLAAFGVGDFLTSPATPFDGIPMASPANFQRAIRSAMNDAEALSTYSWLYNPGGAAPSFGRDTLTFTAPPAVRGPVFNTRSCGQCRDANGQFVVYNGIGATAQVAALRTQFGGGTGIIADARFETWLQTNFGGY